MLLEVRDDRGAYAVKDCDPDDDRWAEIAKLLSRKRNAIHPLQALKLLPGEVR